MGHLDVVAEEQRRVDLKPDLAVVPLEDVPRRFVRRRAPTLAHHERQQTVVGCGAG
jgi:hypothetical protein